MRNSPGRTPCNTPRAASLAPTTTWGIPDAFVIVEGVRATPTEARIVLADCAFRPRLAAATTLVLESACDQPCKVTLIKYGNLSNLGELRPGDVRVIQLPIAGHAVTIPLDANGIYQLATDSKDPETAWIVAAPAVVTEASGQITIRQLATGSHGVRAWLPARGNQPARMAGGTATVVPGELSEITIDLQ